MWVQGESGEFVNSHHLIKIFIDTKFGKKNAEWVIDKFIVKGHLVSVYDYDGGFVKNDLINIKSFDTKQEAEDYLNELINEIGKHEEVRSI